MSEMSGHIHHAIALRYLAAARSQTVNRAVPETATLPEFGELTRTYTKVVDDWVAETPSDAHDVLALVKFVMAVTGQQGSDGEGNSIIGRDRDRFDALVALDSIREWVNEIDLREIHDEITDRRAVSCVDAIIRARTGGAA